MKILISLSYYHPYISGLTVYAKNLAEGLASQGEDVTVLTSQHAKELPLQEKLHGVRVLRIPVTLRVSKGPVMFGFIPKLLSEMRNVDVVNCHLPQFESILIALVAKCFGKRAILTYHTDLEKETTIKGRFIRGILFVSQILAGILADTIVTQSKSYAEQSAYLRFFKKKVIAIYPPIILPEVDRKSLDMFKKTVPLKKYYIGMIGRMAKEKGFEYLLNGIDLLREKIGDDFLILIAGPKDPIGEEAYKEKITRLLAKNERFVKHIGVIPPQDLGAFYSMLDVLAFPSVNNTEAFGMVQVEAMACGTPVVATNSPGIHVPIKVSGMGELSEKENTKDIVDKTVKVLEGKRKYIKDRDIVQRLFGIEEVLNRYKKLFT